jgi:hypothetical protein
MVSRRWRVIVDDVAFVAELVMSKSNGLSMSDSDGALSSSAPPLLLLTPIVAMELFSGVLPVQVPSDLFTLQLHVFHA